MSKRRQWSAGRNAAGTAVPRRPDLHPRYHLRVFAGQVGFLVLSSSPTLLVDDHAPVLFLSLLRSMFGLTALVLLIAGLFSKQRTPQTSFGLWDHCLAFVLLQLGCFIALRMIG